MKLAYGTTLGETSFAFVFFVLQQVRHGKLNKNFNQKSIYQHRLTNIRMHANMHCADVTQWSLDQINFGFTLI